MLVHPLLQQVYAGINRRDINVKGKLQNLQVLQARRATSLLSERISTLVGDR
jgi:hypothetical protein